MHLRDPKRAEKKTFVKTTISTLQNAADIVRAAAAAAKNQDDKSKIFQRVMVQVTKKQTNIINRIIVDVFLAKQ